MKPTEIEKELREIPRVRIITREDTEALLAAADIVAKYNAMGVGNQSYAEIAQERDKLLEELDDWHNATLHVEDEHPDEIHCGCVPILRKQNTELRDCLAGLVKQHEEWNEAVQKIIGRPVRWNDSYLAAARRLLSNGLITESSPK